ncbi:MAG: SirA family protein [Dehalococcoidia bacterium SM23_28_2]|nr:MAG: SirA family protein [Dehalococcoidia bacterium SM23_28_2]
MIEVDVRGFSCPIPVVKTKKAMEENPAETIGVLVESSVSRENVSRLARSRGYSVAVADVEDGFRLVLSPPVGQDAEGS